MIYEALVMNRRCVVELGFLCLTAPRGGTAGLARLRRPQRTAGGQLPEGRVRKQPRQLDGHGLVDRLNLPKPYKVVSDAGEGAFSCEI